MDVWAEVALQFLDVDDLRTLERATYSPLPPLPPGTSFVARRVLDDDQLDWFAARGIRVTLLVEETDEAFKHYSVHQYFLNGKLHRDNDMPAFASNVCCIWYKNGKPHRDGDLPAVECYNENAFHALLYCYNPPAIGRGDRQWWIDGRLHRDGDRPAIENDDGDRKWYFHGELHRDGDLPAVEWADGDSEWYVHGKLHREGDQPAVESTNGDREWCIHGKRHREEDRPAVEYANGSREWWFHGKLHRDNDLPAVVLGSFRGWFRNGRRHRDGGRPAVEDDLWRIYEWYIDGVPVPWWQRPWSWRWRW